MRDDNPSRPLFYSPLTFTQAHDKASAKEAALATRMAAVLAAPNPPSLVDVAEVLFGLHMRHKTAALEDLAFGRLLRILPLGSLHDWSETFTTHADDITGITRIVAQSAAYDGLDDITARLCSRYTGIAANEAGSETYNVVVSVLLQIETVKFAIDWEARRALPGGKKWIGAFFKLMFMQDPSYADAFAGLTERQAEKRFTELKEVYSKWRNKAGHVVTARNRLLKLYNTVRPPTDITLSVRVCPSH
ncbi:hypothetical protein DAEQUDRAFT_550516 [Daedalea quercina L-15889]|uniref:Uncharacterized protein n=1 Tax=Daedalea quercina L-15889 TaxID=1314783 RepID=A0A165T347_9APHY|nr:hypothetical protein DAEQUDRAFT_550516 [Daedalea quercina L-15889]